MKNLVIAALLAVSSAVFANNDHHDTLDTYSQYGHQSYLGHITVLDKEDTIKEVEINGATIVHAWVPNDSIFANGFELYSVNWIWVGDDSNNHEFGYAAHCQRETDSTTHTNNNDNLHVVLSGCHVIQNEPNRP